MGGVVHPCEWATPHANFAKTGIIDLEFLGQDKPTIHLIFGNSVYWHLGKEQLDKQKYSMLELWTKSLVYCYKYTNIFLWPNHNTVIEFQSTSSITQNVNFAKSLWIS